MKKTYLNLTLAAAVLLGAFVADAQAGLTLTNAPFQNTTVVSNVAVAMPVGTWTNATIYAPAVSITQGLQLIWTKNAGNSVGFNVYYGDVTTALTNRFDTAFYTNAVFFGLSSNTTFFFYTTGYDVSRVETIPSNVIIAKPGS